MFCPTLVHDYLSLSAKCLPDKVALVCDGKRWTYQSIDQISSQFACGLVKMGLKRQDRVIIFLDNSAESVISLYGILKAGGVFVILNGSMKAGKLRYIIRDSGAKILITHQDKAREVKEALDNMEEKCQIVWTDAKEISDTLSSISFSWTELIHSCQSLAQRLPQCIDCDLATLIYTSGSTGEPKGVMSSHANMIAAARSIIQYIENREEDIILNLLPLSFDYGLYQVLMAVMFGGTVVLEKSFVYPIKILELLEKERVTGFPIVPTIGAIILGFTKLDRFDLKSLRYITNTAAALPVEHIRKLRAIFPHVRLYSMYGLTECKRVSYLPPEELDHRPSSVGKAIPNCETIIMDETGKALGPEEVGELVIRGANVMQGYWNAPELTARVFRQGRYPGERLLHSGDLFRKDDEGFLYFVGRKDDMIKTRGERVSPKEVENVICGLKGVSEAAVIGVPDEVLGQAVKAFVIRSPGDILGEKEVIKHCSEHLETFMVPKYVVFMTELPKMPNGKIDKKRLRDE
jgi:long-chain acyl-CoA synthetase